MGQLRPYSRYLLGPSSSILGSPFCTFLQRDHTRVHLPPHCSPCDLQELCSQETSSIPKSMSPYLRSLNPSLPSLPPRQCPVLEVSCLQICPGKKEHPRNSDWCRGTEGHCEARIRGQGREVKAMPRWGAGKTDEPGSPAENKS